ncbi:MAG: hypothetical protein JWM02_1106 [Frankiales bacterium]|nr:hypothetical protein [Frankiales bacterium]
MKRGLALSALVLAATACSSPLTPTRLGPPFAEVFGGLYATQQSQLGRTDVTARVLRPLASCRRTGTASDGPGEDWTCTVQYVDGGTVSAQSFEVQLKPDGCWKADGPPGAQPAELVDPATGTHRANPLAEFDGCLDTSWR